MRINLLKLLFGAPMFLVVAPTYACVSDVPVFSIQDLSSMLFLMASLGSLLVLGYMSLPLRARGFIRKGMAVTAMGLGGLIVVGIAASAVQSQMASLPVAHSANFVVPTTPHVLPQRF